MKDVIISIDLWGTLIKSSPSFREEKNKLVQSYFPDLEKHVIEKAFLETKKAIDYIIERTGWQPEQKHLWLTLFSNLFEDGKYLNLEHHRNRELMESYQQVALMNYPAIYSNETKDILEKLSSRYQLVLSSNTLFLPSFVLKEYLDILDIRKYFTKLNFSDELKFSKPYYSMYGASNYHIGDNIRTDFYGAKAHGIDAFLINSNNKTIKDAYNYINEKEMILENANRKFFCT